MSTVPSEPSTLDGTRTLVEASGDDSILADDFEVIERDVSMTQPDSPSKNGDHSVGQWSIQHSISLEPLLDGMGTMPYLNSMSQTPAENVTPTASVINETANVNSLPIATETPVLAGSIALDGMETIASEDTANDDNSTLSSVLLQQQETKVLLEETLAGFSSLTKNFVEKEEMKQELEELRKEYEESKAALEASRLLLEETKQKMDEVEKENRELVERVRVLEAGNKGDTAVAQELNKLMEQLYEKGLQIDARDTALTNLRAELDAAHRANTDLQENTNQRSSEKEDYLTMQLDVMCAKFLDMKEQFELSEERLRAAMHDRGDVFSTPMYDNQAVAEQLRLKNEQVAQLERKISAVEEENQNKEEIIKVLGEDHVESTRQLTEKDHKISEMEQQLEQLSESYERRLQYNSGC